MKQGCTAEIIEYFGSNNVTIQFEDGTILYKRFYQALLKKEIKNPNYPSLYEVGYSGVGQYNSKKHFVVYNRWRSVFQRCYDKKYQEKNPTYSRCTVDEEWHNFQNFAKWFYENYKEGWQMDKDILVKGNKIYSPKTCCFVPTEINVGVASTRVNGVYKYDKTRCKAILNGKIIGISQSTKELTKLYKTAKEEHIKNLADKWKDLIAPKVYQALINYKVEITD